MNIFAKAGIIIGTSFLLQACSSSSSSDGGGVVYEKVACTNTSADSQLDPGGLSATRINSFDQGSPGYYGIAGVREDYSLGSVDIDYMVHPAQGVATPKAILLMIAGGQLNAGITGPDGFGAPTGSGGNFLVRSAHLFAAQGYKVVTMDRPSDHTQFTTVGTQGWRMDPYRVSMEHAVDISRIIADENPGNDLPVIIVGTSRGAISAVANAILAEAIAISGPVTSGDNGQPVGSINVDPALVNAPTSIIWHVNDACSVTQPSDSTALVGDFANAEGKAISGGFNDPNEPNMCRAKTYHGFFGIESCAVGVETAWMDSVVTGLPATRPDATTADTTASVGITKEITLTATASAGGDLTFDIPYQYTALNGIISLSGATATYNAPGGGNGKTDSFVYTVREAGAGMDRRVVRISIAP